MIAGLTFPLNLKQMQFLVIIYAHDQFATIYRVFHGDLHIITSNKVLCKFL